MKLVFWVIALVGVASAYAEDGCKPFPELSTVPFPQDVSNAQLSRDGSFFSYQNEKWETILQHRATGKTINVGKVNEFHRSKDYNSVSYYRTGDTKGTVTVTGVKSGVFRKTEHPHAVQSTYGISPDGRYSLNYVGEYANNISTYFIELTDLENGVPKKIKWPGYINSDTVAFTQDGKHIIAGESSKLFMYDTASGEFQSAALTGTGNLTYHAQTNQLIEGDSYGKITFANLNPGYHYSDDQFSITVPGGSNCGQKMLSQDGNRLLIKCGSEMISLDVKNRVVLDRIRLGENAYNINISPNLHFFSGSGNNSDGTQLFQVDDNGRFSPGMTVFTSYPSVNDHGFSGFSISDPSPNSKRGEYIKLRNVCPIPLDPGKCPNCGNDSSSSLPLNSIHKKWLEEIEIGQLCKLPFQTKDWDKSFPKLSADKVAEKELMAFLLRFQKKGGFEYEKHVQILITILNSGLSTREPQLITGMLQSINLELPWLYDHLLQLYPFLADYSPDPNWTNPCRTPEEVKALDGKVVQYLNERIKNAGSSRDFTYFEPLKLYTPILTKLSKDKKDAAIEKITEAVRGSAIGNDLLRNVFPSKLYYLAMGAVSPLFGNHHEGILTDLTYERSYNNEVVPIILGPSSIGDSKKTRFGFHARRLAPLALNKNATEDQNFKVRWHQNGEKFEGTLKVQHVDLKDIVSTDKAPNYKEMYQDKTLTGAILVGTNLKSHSAGLLDQYLQYYLTQGFEFSEIKVKIPDMLTFFKEGVEKGSWDYFAKEAHSDGDDKNLFRFDKKSEYLRGVKKNSDGTSEEIYLVFPDASNGETVLLSNQEFGEWVRNRKKDGKGQLAYFNTSCSSSYKAVREVEAARSSTLLDVATGNSALTFSNSSTSAFRAVLHGFRSQKTYEQIRADLTAIPGYNRGNQDNYLFPDDPQYDSSITKQLMPFGVQIGIKDGKGKDYHIDEVLSTYH